MHHTLYVSPYETQAWEKPSWWWCRAKESLLLSDLLQDDGVPIRDRKGLELRLDAEADYKVVCARGACIHSTLMLTAIP